MPSRPTGRTAQRRPPTGAAVLQEHVTSAIHRAALKELARVGYARVSIEAIARRAGVGKAAIYRRWSTKFALVAHVISDAVSEVAETTETGSLRNDLRLFLTTTTELLRRPMTQRILADLMAETRRDLRLAAALRTGVQERRRTKAAEILKHAVARGELSADLDVDLALDFLAGPLYWRIIATRGATSPEYLERLADMLLAALTARGARCGS